MVAQLVRIERDADGQALNDLHPVARRILCRDEREGRARTPCKARDLAVIHHIAAVKVRCQFDRHADAHTAQLALLEIGIDISGRGRHDRHDRRARRDALADLHLAIGDHTVDRRPDHRALHVEPCRIEARTGGGDVGRGRDAGATRQRLGRGQIAVRRQAGRLRGGNAGTCQIAGGAGARERGACGAQFVGRHRAASGQRLTPREFDPCALISRIGFGNARPGLGDIGPARRQLRARRADLRRCLAIALLRLEQRRLRRRDIDLRIGRVEHDEHIAFLHHLSTADADFGDGS